MTCLKIEKTAPVTLRLTVIIFEMCADLAGPNWFCGFCLFLCFISKQMLHIVNVQVEDWWPLIGVGPGGMGWEGW